MTALRRLATLLLLPVALGLPGCGISEPRAFRHPDFTPLNIRRPAVLLQVSLDQAALLGEGERSPRERSSIPEAFEIALLEGLNAEGILPVDVTLSARRSTPAGRAPFEGIDRRQALDRGRALDADVVVIVGAVLSRLDLVFCREGRRPFIARTTLWTLGAEILRVADRARLLVEPPGPTLQLGDVEPDCERGGIGRRLSVQELLDAAVHRILSLLLRR